MKVSIVTVCFNSETHIGRCLLSVVQQSHNDIEHIIIDGGSTDKTLNVVHTISPSSIVISEPDDGIYDAMNKGYRLCSGEILFFLNSDDRFADKDVVGDVVKFLNDTNVDGCFCNINMFNQYGRVVRRWIPGNIQFWPRILQPQLPHPGLFLRKSSLTGKKKLFPTEFLICGDLYLQINLIKEGFNLIWFDRVAVQMALGGESTKNLGALLKGWIESRAAWNRVYGWGGSFFVIQKVFRKLFQLRWWVRD